MTFRGGRERRVAEWTIRMDQNGRQLGGHRRGPGRRPLERKWTFLNSFRESGKTMSGKVWRMVSLPFGQKMAGQKIAQYLIRLYRFQQGGVLNSKACSAQKSFTNFNVFTLIYSIYLICRLIFCNFELIPVMWFHEMGLESPQKVTHTWR